MMNTKKRMTVLAAAAALLVGLTACGAGGGGGSSSSQDTLIYANAADADFLDPGLSNSPDAARLINSVYETLATFAMKGDSLIITDGGLAKSWDISDDGLTYTFHLREGVKFQDGEPFNADAVVYNFDRLKSGGEKYTFYPAYFGAYGDEGNLKSFKALDENTVEITLGKTDAFFLNSIASTKLAMVSPKAGKADTLNEHPVGTGPFEFVSWKKNDTITVKKFDGYWHKGLPKLDEVVFKVIADPAARATALKTGEVDVISDVNPTDVEQIREDSKLKVMYRPSMNLGYMGMNVKIAPFDNLDVRQAMNYAINTQEIVKNFYDGDSIPATGAIPPAANGFSGAPKSPYSFDPAKAKELLGEAGYPDGFSTDLWVPAIARAYMPNPPKTAEYIQANLAAVGVKVNIVTYDLATYLEKLDRGNEAPMYLYGGTTADGTVTGVMNWQFRSTAQGTTNRMSYNSPQFDQELLAVRQSTDEKALLEHLYKAQSILYQDAPYVPIAHSTPAVAVVAGLDGLVPAANNEDVLTDVEFTK